MTYAHVPSIINMQLNGDLEKLAYPPPSHEKLTTKSVDHDIDNEVNVR